MRYINSRSHIFHTVQGKVAKIDRIRDAERDGERQWETEGDRKKHMKVNDKKEKPVVAESESSQRSSHFVTTVNYRQLPACFRFICQQLFFFSNFYDALNFGLLYRLRKKEYE